jgi:hypothetical protein
MGDLKPGINASDVLYRYRVSGSCGPGYLYATDDEKKEVPMSDREEGLDRDEWARKRPMNTGLKPCPICKAPAWSFQAGRFVGCTAISCPLHNAGMFAEAWQALPRPENPEAAPAPEPRTCETCFFEDRPEQSVPCMDCDRGDSWKPDRPGDEVRIREILEAPPPDDLLRHVIFDGQALTTALGISYYDALRSRMEEATQRLGPWDVNDGRDYRMEALEELLDAASYLGAEKVREEKACE